MGIKETIAIEADAAEASREEPIPKGAVGTRPGRARAVVLSVRLNSEELDELTARAEATGVPVSTMARSLIIRGLRSEGRIDMNESVRDVVLMTVRETVPEVLEKLLPRATA